MNSQGNYSRPIGFAEMVRQHGDHWQYAGISYSQRIHDERLLKAYLSADKINSSDTRDFIQMCFYTKRIYPRPINEVRGRA